MLNSMRKSILEIDAFLQRSTSGKIIIENNKAYLYTGDKEIEIRHDDKIKISNNRDYIDVTYNDLINTICTDGFPLYAGKDALIKDR